ncbi:MAG: VWA domain-containing protein [Rhodospirillaceae bacterium]|nr:VWA domain-containing protein [Rhodospirillaceae bacterium]
MANQLNTGSGEKLSDNVLYFARVLRSAGIPIGSGRILDAIKAIDKIGLADKSIFYWALHSVFVHKNEHREIFDQAFKIFWKNPRLLEKMMQLALPRLNTGTPGASDADINRRVQEAFNTDNMSKENYVHPSTEDELKFDAVMTYSESELLQGMDFEQMSSDEINKAKKVIAQMNLSIPQVKSRRFKNSSLRRKIDLRQSLKGANKFCGEYIPLRYKSRKDKNPPIIAICDISGSMSRYSRMLLHFMHVLTTLRNDVHTFLFGTRLTNVTRFLRFKDVDEALAATSSAVEDWSGGTRIGDCLKDFNFNWSRRVLGPGAIVLFITDGLDRGGGIGLSKQIKLIQKSSKRLIWLNPLLRYEEFAPKPTGVKAILPYVDEFRPIHSLESMDQLVNALSETNLQSRFNMAPWLQKLSEIENAECH